MYPFKLEPIYWDCIWGNDKLARIRKDPSIHGTSWEISAHPHADNRILNGKYQGRTMMQMLEEYPEKMLGEKQRSQMLRLCYLDAAQSLSIQVHPDNDYARIHEKDEGKTESWYMLHVDEGAVLIAGTTASSKEELMRAVEEDRIEEAVNRIGMEEEDFICIDAGQLHALGAGILALEIGTNSDTTYRFYDYHRKGADGKERELHLRQSFDVVDTSKQCEKSHHPFLPGQEEMMIDREEFSIRIVDLDGEYSFVPDKKRFYCLSNVSADCELICNGEKMPFAYTENLFVPADCGPITLTGKSRILISFVR